jgi:peptide deformylase
VGLALRMFVMNPTGEPADARTFVNPAIRDKHGAADAEEGCLSLPGVFVQVRRAASCAIDAQDLTGKPIRVEGSELIARVWQHETDHLDGRLIIDRMGPADKLATRKTLQALEEQHRTNPSGRHDGKIM